MTLKGDGGRFIWLWALSPAVFGLLIVLLLAEFQLIEFHFSIHDIDTFILFSGLLLTTLITFVLLSREAIRRIQVTTERRLRLAFAEDRTRFLRRLDHEIKNPLMGIQTALDNLSQESDPAQRGIIRSAINEQIDHLARLVADLRRIGDLAQYEIERLPVDTRLLLDESFSMISDYENAAARDLHYDVPDDLPRITGDYDLLLLAIHNILINALKYTRPGDKIRLRARVEDDCFYIAVTDTGPGIQPQDLPYVMDELYRAQQVKDIAGSGIGLSLVRRIVERHQGKVVIDSTPGKGTRVVLCLPFGQAAEG